MWAIRCHFQTNVTEHTFRAACKNTETAKTQEVWKKCKIRKNAWISKRVCILFDMFARNENILKNKQTEILIFVNFDIDLLDMCIPGTNVCFVFSGLHACYCVGHFVAARVF